MEWVEQQSLNVQSHSHCSVRFCEQNPVISVGIYANIAMGLHVGHVRFLFDQDKTERYVRRHVTLQRYARKPDASRT